MNRIIELSKVKSTSKNRNNKKIEILSRQIFRLQIGLGVRDKYQSNEADNDY